MKKTKELGITLIALVVTIIVLLILAGITISTIIGDNGILTQATRAKEENRVAAILEEWNMIKAEIVISKTTNTSIITKDQIASRLSNVGMTSTEIDALITKEGSITLNDETILKYADLGLGTSETISLEGKSAIFLGDSVAYGYSTGGNGFGYYIDKSENLGSYTNAAVGSATINTFTQKTNNVIEQIKKYQNNDYDFVILQGGYGDLRDVATLGNLTNYYNISDFDTTTFAGAVEYTLYLATTTWPNARIGFIISYDTPNSNYGVRPNHEEAKKYWDILKSACDKWNVPYLDFFEGSTIYNGEVKTYSELFQVTTNTYLDTDNIHPTSTGYEFICPFIANWMKTLNKYSADFVIENTNEKTAFNQLIFVKGTTISGSNGEFLQNVTGRAACYNQLLKVKGNETIGLSAIANDVSYSIYEFDENMNSSGGEKAKRWITDNITLNSNTRYIKIAFKNGDGINDFTNEQIQLLPTYIEFK